MLTLTVLKSVVLVAGLVAASMFLQAAMTYGKLPLILGQCTTARPLGRSPGKSANASYPQTPSPNSANQLISLVRLKIIDGSLVPSRLPAIVGSDIVACNAAQRSRHGATAR